MRTYDIKGKRWEVVRAGIALLADDGGRKDLRSRAKVLIADACRGFREEDWIELRRLTLPPVPAETAHGREATDGRARERRPGRSPRGREELRKIGVDGLPLLLQKSDAPTWTSGRTSAKTIRGILTQRDRP
jgi:hypothetical protein